MFIQLNSNFTVWWQSWRSFAIQILIAPLLSFNTSIRHHLWLWIIVAHSIKTLLYELTQHMGAIKHNIYDC
jgi:hypothetical protein